MNFSKTKHWQKNWGIDEIPAFLLYKDGKLFTRKNGMMEEKDLMIRF